MCIRDSIYADRTAMGAAAARDGAALLRRLLAQQDTVRAVFAAAPSQNEMCIRDRAYPDSYPLAFRSFAGTMAQMNMIAPSWGTYYLDITDNRYFGYDYDACLLYTSLFCFRCGPNFPPCW